MCLQNSSTVLGFPEVQSVVQWVVQASILGPGQASEGDFSEIWDMLWKERLVASTEQGQGYRTSKIPDSTLPRCLRNRPDNYL